MFKVINQTECFMSLGMLMKGDMMVPESLTYRSETIKGFSVVRKQNLLVTTTQVIHKVEGRT